MEQKPKQLADITPETNSPIQPRTGQTDSVTSDKDPDRLYNVRVQLPAANTLGEDIASAQDLNEKSRSRQKFSADKQQVQDEYQTKEESSDQENQKKPAAYNEEQLIGRGLYKKVRISVKMLDILIVLGIAAIIGILIFGVHHSGYQVSFNSKGGSDVQGASYQYGDLLKVPDVPDRQGYVFAGWYLDENCTIPLTEPFEIESDQTFYAKWEPAP